ncbi:MAG: CehA/McbA family metallohydrolase [Caldisericia bacterium]
MKRVLALILVCALLSVSAAGHPLPAVQAAGEVLYLEIPQDSYCRAPATTVYLPIMLGNLSTDPSMLIRSIEVLDAKGQAVATERTEFKLESFAGKADSIEEIRTALGIIPPAATDIVAAQSLITQATGTADSKQKSILIEQAWFASRAKQSMKNPDELTAEEAKMQQLLKPVTLAVDLPQFTTDTTSESAVSVTVRITGELSEQPFIVERQTIVFLLTSLPNGGMWHPGDGHVHTQGLALQPDSPSDYTLAAKENYGFSDATDGATVKARRDQANSKGMQWLVITDHAGDGTHITTPAFQPRLNSGEWGIYQTACSRATTQYSPAITVCPGEELATRELSEYWIPETGHLLSYQNTSYAPSFSSCQNLTSSAVNAGGFGIVAHPFSGSIPWSNWNATPWNGLEVMSNESTPNSSAITKWDQTLLSRLSDEISGRYRCVAMANSDVHTSSSAGWGANMNYIYTGSYAAPGTSTSTVWDAINQGRLTASSNGSFAAATVNGFYPGSSMAVLRNATVSVSITGTQANSSDSVARVRVYQNGTEVNSPPDIPINGTNFTCSVPVLVSQNCYIRVAVFFGNGSTWSGYCLVNPVFVGISN